MANAGLCGKRQIKPCLYVFIFMCWPVLINLQSCLPLRLLYQVGQKYELLNCDKHKALAKKLKKDIAMCRPDIVHQVLCAIFSYWLRRATVEGTSSFLQKSRGG